MSGAIFYIQQIKLKSQRTNLAKQHTHRHTQTHTHTHFRRLPQTNIRLLNSNHAGRGQVEMKAHLCLELFSDPAPESVRRSGAGHFPEFPLTYEKRSWGWNWWDDGFTATGTCPEPSGEGRSLEAGGWNMSRTFRWRSEPGGRRSLRPHH